MMKAKKMRWGYDGGGIACGPVGGNVIVELMVMDDERHYYFICDSMMDGFEKIDIAEVPLFDLEMQLLFGCDLDYEIKKIKKLAVETYDFETADPPEEMMRSRFAKAIQLVRLAMEEHYNNAEEGEDYESAENFFIGYEDADLDCISFPTPFSDDEEEEED